MNAEFGGYIDNKTLPLAGDLGEAVGSKVDRRSSPHNFYNLSKHQVVARMEAHQGRIESQPHARARTIKK